MIDPCFLIFMTLPLDSLGHKFSPAHLPNLFQSTHAVWYISCPEVIEVLPIIIDSRVDRGVNYISEEVLPERPYGALDQVILFESRAKSGHRLVCKLN